MNTYEGCIIIVAVPNQYPFEEKIREHLLPQFPGAEIRFFAERSATKPFIGEVVIPDWHEPTAGVGAGKPPMRIDLYDAATAALLEVMRQPPK